MIRHTVDASGGRKEKYHSYHHPWMMWALCSRDESIRGINSRKRINQNTGSQSINLVSSKFWKLKAAVAWRTMWDGRRGDRLRDYNISQSSHTSVSRTEFLQAVRWLLWWMPWYYAIRSIRELLGDIRISDTDTNIVVPRFPRLPWKEGVDSGYVS